MANAPIVLVAPKVRSVQYNGTNSAQILNGLIAVSQPSVTTWSILSEAAGILTVRRSEKDSKQPTITDIVINTNDILVAGKDGTGLGEILTPSAFAAAYYVLP
jgi:hypothetical protein